MFITVILSASFSLVKSAELFYTLVNTADPQLGIEPEPPGTPGKDALLVGFSYLIAACIPLFPYFFFKGEIAILSSILATLLALFGIGLLKAKFALLPYLKSGLQVLLVGAGSGIGGYFLGTLLPHILGMK